MNELLATVGAGCMFLAAHCVPRRTRSRVHSEGGGGVAQGDLLCAGGPVAGHRGIAKEDCRSSAASLLAEAGIIGAIHAVGRTTMIPATFVTLTLWLCVPSMSAGAQLWWAFANGYTIENGLPVKAEAYGIAWNYPDRDAAEQAALAECQKRFPTCEISAWSTRRCFAVGQYDRWVLDNGVRPYVVRTANTPETLQTVINRDAGSSIGPFRPELTKCMGN